MDDKSLTEQQLQGATTGAQQSESPTTVESDIFYIDEIDAVPADSLLTMRC